MKVDRAGKFRPAPAWVRPADRRWMPSGNLILLVGVFCLGFLATPARAQEASPRDFAFDSVAVTESRGGITCYRGSRHIVVQRPLSGGLDSDFFVRPSESDRCDADSLAGDVVLRDEWAAYFSGMRDDVLFVDSGTGPDVRYLILFDMQTGRRIAELPYVETAAGRDSSSVGVWEPSELEETLSGCKAPTGGLLPGVDSLFYVNIRSGERRFSGRTRCAVRQ